MIWLAATALSWAASPVVIKVEDPNVVALVLDCGGGKTIKAVVKGGQATVAEVLSGRCDISMIRKGGFINGPGTWNCSLDTCKQTKVAHRATTDEPGTVNIIMTDKSKVAQMEVKCSTGHRDRQNVVENTVIFRNVPQDPGCEVLFKGGVPAKYRPVSWGTYHCQLTGTTAVCQKKSAP